MATTYDRRINLYINGKEIKNDISSIRKEMYKMTNEQSRMTRGSAEYNQKAAEIRKLRGILSEHQAQLRATTSAWQKAKNIFSQFAPAAGFAALGAGITRFARQSDEAFTNLEERVNNLSALTGLEGKELEWLTQKAKETSVATVEGNIRIKQSADAIVDAYTKVGSKRPELLKSKEDLANVTQEAIILSEAAKTELEPAVAGLTMALNQFDMAADQSRRIINVLAAGSKVGAGDIPYLTQAMEKSGTTANLMKIPIEQWAGAVESIAPYYEQAAMAGNSFDKVLLKMKEKQIGYVNGTFDLNTALDQLQGMYASGKSSAEIFGVEHSKMGELLVKERAKLNDYTAAVTGSNVAIEQASKNTSGEMAKRAQEANRMKLIMIDFGKTISPVLTESMTVGRKLAEVLFGLFKIFMENKGLIISVTAGIVAYNIALAVSNISLKENIILTKLKTVWDTAMKGALLLAAAAQALFTGNTMRANAAMKLFNATTKLNPIALVVSLIAAAVVGLALYSKKLNQVTAAQKALNDVEIAAQQNIAGEKVKMEQLMRIAQNESLTKERRKKAIEDLNKLSPEYLGNLTLETINTDAAKTATDKYIDSLLKKAKIQAAEESLIELEKERIKATQEGTDYQSKWYQTAWNGVKALGNANQFAMNQAVTGAKNATAAEDEYLKKKEALIGLIGKETAAIDKQSTAGGGGGSPIADPKKLAKAQQDALELAHAERLNSLKEQYYKEELTQDEYETRMLASELGYLELKKQMLLTQGQSVVEIDGQIWDKRIEINKQKADVIKKLHEDMAKDVDELFKAEADAVTDAVNQSVDEGSKAVNQYKKNMDDEEAILKQRASNYLDLAQGIGESFEEMLLNQEMSFGQFLKNTLMMALDALEKIMIMSVTEATMKGIVQTGLLNPAALAKAFAKVVAIKAAFGAAKALVLSGSKGKKEGGYTEPGNKNKPVGIVHAGEWVASQWMVNHPVTGPAIAALENARKNGPQINPNIIPMFAAGGYASPSSISPLSTGFNSPPGSGGVPAGGGGISDPNTALISKLDEMITRIEKIQPRVAIDLFEREKQKYIDIKKFSGI